MHKDKRNAWAKAVFGGLFVLLSPLWLVAGPDVCTVFGFLAFLLAGGGLAAGGITTLVAYSAFTQAEVLALAPGRLGGHAEVEVVLAPRRALPLNPEGCTATYACIEKAVYTAGTSSRTYTETVAQAAIPGFRLPSQLVGPARVRLLVPVPVNVPPTFAMSSNSFIHQVTVHLDITGWPDLTMSGEITVLPELEVARG